MSHFDWNKAIHKCMIDKTPDKCTDNDYIKKRHHVCITWTFDTAEEADAFADMIHSIETSKISDTKKKDESL